MRTVALCSVRHDLADMCAYLLCNLTERKNKMRRGAYMRKALQSAERAERKLRRLK